METTEIPKTWLLESILVTLFCCLPFGIVGIINASKVSSTYAMGNHELANKYSADAAKWTKIGAIVGVILIILGVIYNVFFLKAMTDGPDFGI